MKRKLIREQINKRKNKKGGLITEKKKSEGITKKKTMKRLKKNVSSECEWVYVSTNKWIHLHERMKLIKLN